MLGELVQGNDRLVPLAFHVDYFDKPWKDRFSSPQFSRREWQYSTLYNQAKKIGKEDYLYFTPMLMVDGRYPMLGTDRPKAQKAIREARATRPAVSLAVTLEPGQSPREATAVVTLGRAASSIAGKSVLVGLAIWEDPVTTRVEKGENAGKTLTERFVVRKLEVQPVTPSATAPRTLRIPLALESDWDIARCGVAAYVQDEKTGRIHNATRQAWNAANAASPASGTTPGR